MLSAEKFIQSDSTSGPSAIGAAHGAEDRRDLLHGAADRMDQAGLARARRQGGIETFGGQPGVEFGVLQCGAAGLDQGGERVLEPVQRGAALAALLGRGLARDRAAAR